MKSKNLSNKILKTIKSKGFKYILTIKDRGTKFVQAIPLVQLHTIQVIIRVRVLLKV